MKKYANSFTSDEIKRLKSFVKIKTVAKEHDISPTANYANRILRTGVRKKDSKGGMFLADLRKRLDNYNR
ncbi:hypothetical protein HN014_07975 [Aquimarina sp. TRL1]|uniref:hypothetical protein n=1 Tax=Aquimarina sp. (strain TRL1) TaxID=2736252 RepID=UPI001589838D|nr:hypothetical protein [Aquimarina sp. TRL1]QKX04855.1 hypothetical protein HN014_07975 [Aquimarina sp. TRL1]